MSLRMSSAEEYFNETPKAYEIVGSGKDVSAMRFHIEDHGGKLLHELPAFDFSKNRIGVVSYYQCGGEPLVLIDYGPKGAEVIVSPISDKLGGLDTYLQGISGVKLKKI